MKHSIQLSNACDITTGKMDANQAVKNGEFPFFTCSSMPDTIDSFAFDKDAVLVAGNNAQGNFHVSRFNGKFNAYQRTYVLTAKPNFDIDFVFYSLKLELKRLKDRSQGSQTKFLTMPILNSIALNNISKIEQVQIASILSSLDSKIALNNRINAELEAMAKTVYDYWFVQFDFPNAEGKPYKSSGGKMVWCEELKREVPEGWEVGTIGHIADLVRGVSYDSQNIKSQDDENVIPILRATNISGNVIDLNNMVYVPVEFVSEKQILKQYDILLTMSSGSKDHIGKNGFFYFDEKVSFGAFCAKLVAKSNFKFYLFSFTQSEFMFQTIKNECLGTNINNLNGGIVNRFKLIKPSNDVLENFNNIVEPIYKKIGNNQQENQQLSSLRDWLLPMLMNGQVRVGAQAYAEMEEGDGLMAAEESVGYDINNSIKSDKKWTIGNRTILAGYIIKRFNCKGFGRVMLMKLLFLVEYICKIDFESHYVVNVAGPYDDLIREIELKLRTYKLFNAKQEKFGNQVSYEDMGGSDIVESLFTESFCQEADQINSILDKFLNSKWDQCEIVATLYAVWNNRILNNYQINDMVLKQDFLNWDPQKVKYENRLDDMLVWMRKNDIVPIGWGKLIEK